MLLTVRTRLKNRYKFTKNELIVQQNVINQAVLRVLLAI